MDDRARGTAHDATEPVSGLANEVIPPLPADECHVWWASPQAAAPHLLPLLSQAEHTRMNRFGQDADRARYLVARALARTVLSAHLGIPPREITFSTVCRHCGGPHGKPAVAGASKPVELSISHSGERVVLAVARDVPLGVDVERLESRVNPAGLIKRTLSGPERDLLATVPEADRTVAFLTYWTRKEALLKATGHGLAISPAHLTLTAPDVPPALLSWDARSPLEAPARLYDLSPGPGHLAALATLGGAELRVVERDAHALLAPSALG
jgi:4'-phosphopantetheinyl transferase